MVPRRGFGEIGMLLENQLGIDNNDFSFADIDGIELKTSDCLSKYPISLFSCGCDGPDFFELKRLVERFGVCDYDFPCAKVMYICLSNKEFSNWGKNLKMKLDIDWQKEKVFIIVANTNGKIIEKKSYWNFSTLENIMERKLKYMCYVLHKTSFYNKRKYCKFEKVIFLKNRGFIHFLRLLENGEIIVNIKYGVHKRGRKAGQAYNHGTAFILKKNALFYLFEHF